MSSDSDESSDIECYGGKIEESISAGDTLEYYSAIGVAGDPQWFRSSLVLAVDPSDRSVPVKQVVSKICIVSKRKTALRIPSKDWGTKLVSSYLQHCLNGSELDIQIELQ